MKKVLKQLHQVQENDFIIFKDLLLNCIKEYLPKTLNLSVFSDVFKNCDSIDYQNEEIVAAYVMLHLLDRYVRFQKIQEELLKRGFLEKWINMKNRGVKANPNYKLKMRILDVGTGPAPALFAFSDLYEWIKKFYNNKIDIKEDYIEQSHGFRQFLHFFVEMSLKKDKRYHVPFHHGNFYSLNEFRESDYAMGRRGIKAIRRKFDIVIFSNFLTNEKIIDENQNYIKEILNSVTNGGLILIVGANPNLPKYKKVYKKITNIIGDKYKFKEFYGNWENKYDGSMSVKYKDLNISNEYASYFLTIKEILENNSIYNNLEKTIRERIEKCITGGDEAEWHLYVFRKKSAKYRKINYVKNRLN